MRIALAVAVTLAWAAEVTAQCPTGDACNDGLYCTVADTCNGAGACVGLPRACGDLHACTTDYCDEGASTCRNDVVAGQCFIGGVCYGAGATHPADTCLVCAPAFGSSVWSPNTGATCDDDLFCTVDDTCADDAECQGRPRVCDDLLSCTNDSCNETTDACESLQQDDSCVIDDLCYAAGLVNPRNACEACDPSRDAAAWSPLADTACDDAMFCTVDDACNADGACVGSARACDDGDTCTLDVCVEGLARCEHTTTETSCWIDATCVADGAANPANGCLGCDPATDGEAWSVRAGEGCDDGLFCTVGDTCSSAGGCAGAPNPCDDGLACTVDRCDEESRDCSHALAPGTCLIEGACYSFGQRNPDDPEQACDPGADGGWTAAPPQADASTSEGGDDDGSGCGLGGRGTPTGGAALVAIALLFVRRRARSTVRRVL